MLQCPRCQSNLVKQELGYFCPSCSFSLPFVYRGKRLDETMLSTLLSTGKSGSSAWIRHDTGRLFFGHLGLTSEMKITLVPHYLSDVHCPLCKEKVLSTPIGWECVSGDVKVWETVASRKLTEREVRQLFLYGVTEKLDGFVSKETDKRFSAKLRIDEAGEVVFDFGK